MGKYIPSPRQAAKTIAEMLREAEDDHYLDCPDAEPLARAAAFVLDIIFLLILWGAFTRIYRAVIVNGIVRSLFPNFTPEFTILLNAVEIAMEAVLLFYFLVWPTSNFGGTPAKLLFGLRVIDSDTGHTLNIVRAALREIVGKLVVVPLTLGYGAAMIKLRLDRRGLHDVFSGSSVKRVHVRKGETP